MVLSSVLSFHTWFGRRRCLPCTAPADQLPPSKNSSDRAVFASSAIEATFTSSGHRRASAADERRVLTMSFDTKSLYMRGHSGQIPQAESIRQAELHSKAMDLAFNQADRSYDTPHHIMTFVVSSSPGRVLP